uniref:Protection of telomeres protein 1 n=1 Tax=Labrus bergylta TaxID=56723 RepID=A0A3Q3L761_9LABR
SQLSSINVVLMGALAKEFSQAVNQGDVVVASGFTVGKSPTVNKDKLHPCNLYYSTLLALVVIYCPSCSSSGICCAPKYTYVRLGDLKAGPAVNVYGVVTFFKQPYKSRGTDFCSILKITDQSKKEILCKVFCKKLEDHPNIFQIGDIVRLHGVKPHSYRNCIELVKTFGFSALTFDGVVGRPVEPRTSSRSFHFDQDDRRVVEELRSWASGQGFLPAVSTITLSAVEPKQYFDLTCQLLAKAPIDTTCILLRVWDGTRCPYKLLKVIVEPDVTEGPSSFSAEKESVIANILIYDNHVESAKQLKPGDFLRIYNLRAIPGSSKVPGLTSTQAVEVDHMAFHLHGGTAFGRGIRLLPEDSPEVQELKRVIAAIPGDEELSDSEMMEVWSTPPESLVPLFVSFVSLTVFIMCVTERTCGHDVQPVMLSQLKRSEPGRVHHVRVQLRSYEPLRLHQALKLYCSKCTTMREVPDDEVVDGVFSEASRDSGPCSPPTWALSGQTPINGRSGIAGSTLEETCHLASTYQNIVPVRSSGGQMDLLDLSAPFLFRGRKRYYGCKRCSEAAVREPCAVGVELIDEKVVAEALGVQLLQFVLLMKLELQDSTDTLDVFLWRDAVSFHMTIKVQLSLHQRGPLGIQCWRS